MVPFCPGRHATPSSRREVVAIRGVAAARNAVCAHADQRAGGGVVHVGAVRGIDRRRVVFEAHPGGNREVRPSAPRVLKERVLAVRAQVLWIIQMRHTGDRGQPDQHFRQRVAGHTHETQVAFGHHVAVRVLLEPAQIHPGFEQVPSAHRRERIGDLIDRRSAVLGLLYSSPMGE